MIIGGREVLPHVKSDPLNFGLFFTAVLLFVPTFFALVVSYLRARKMDSA